VLDGETEPAPAYPRILHARRNTFVDNDVAVELRGRAIAVSGTTPIVDFGRPDDPGGNTFACNVSARPSPSDVALGTCGEWRA
jgi:hypothetical protein